MDSLEIINVKVFNTNRKRKGWYKAYMAEQLGIGKEATSNLFRNGILPADLERKAYVIDKLCQLLEVTRDELVIKLITKQ